MSAKPKPPDQLSRDEAQAEHARLGAEIAGHDRRYHGEDAPTISDAEYDALRRRYAALEEAFPELAGADSLSRKVGAAPAKEFAKVRHVVPMLSLGNVFVDEEVEEFCARVRRFLGLGDDGAARLHRRAEDRRPLLLAALRARQARPGGDARRRLRGRGRHRQCAHHRRDPADAAPTRRRCSRRAAKSIWRKPISPRSTRASRRPASRPSPIRATPPPARCASSTRRSPPSGR